MARGSKGTGGRGSKAGGGGGGASSGAIRAGAAFVELFTKDSQLAKGLKAASEKVQAWATSVAKIAAGGFADVEAGIAALNLPESYYAELAVAYARRRDMMMAMLERHGFRVFTPAGAYYVMTDITAFGAEDDVAFARELVTRAGVAAVPGSSFYRDQARGRTKLRFCFSKRDDTMAEADRRLAVWARGR